MLNKISDENEYFGSGFGMHDTGYDFDSMYASTTYTHMSTFKYVITGLTPCLLCWLI